MTMANARTILVVEDNPLNMELVIDLLEYEGFHVLQAANAEVALPLARSEKPDLVLMDIALPGMDGLEATRRLREDPATREIPVVALTASAMQVDEQRVLQAGCLGVIYKPIDTRGFARLVAGYLGDLPADVPKKGNATSTGGAREPRTAEEI